MEDRNRPDDVRVVGGRLQFPRQPVGLRRHVAFGVQADEADVADGVGVIAVARRGLRQREQPMEKAAGLVRRVGGARIVVVAEDRHEHGARQLVRTNLEKIRPRGEAGAPVAFVGQIAQLDHPLRVLQQDPIGHGLPPRHVQAAVQIAVQRKMQRRAARRRGHERGGFAKSIRRAGFVEIARARFQPAQRNRMVAQAAAVARDGIVIRRRAIAHFAAPLRRRIPADRRGRGGVFGPRGAHGRRNGLARGRQRPQPRRRAQPRH